MSMDHSLEVISKSRDTALSVAEALYGDAVWEIAKSLDKKGREDLGRKAALVTTAQGVAAGPAAIGLAIAARRQGGMFRQLGHAVGRKAGVDPEEPVKVARKLTQFPQGSRRWKMARLAGETANKLNRPGSGKYKAAAAVAGGTMIALQTGNMFGDAIATKHLANAGKKPKEIHKADDTVDFVARAEISKMDTDKRQVFGWASIIEIDGEPVVDYQDDVMTIETVEKAAYDYVKSSRKGGNQHQRNGEEPLHVSDMIESFLVTKEKKEQMGLPDSVPTGWWVGFQVNDEDTWQEVKSGKKRALSIHGSGVRKEVEV